MNRMLACAVALLCAAELSDDERHRVAEYRRQQIAATAKEIAAFEKESKAAQRSRDKQRAEELKGKVSVLRKRINELKQANDDELFTAMREAEREAAAVAFQAEQEQQREREIAAAGPVSILRMGIVTNVIGLPELVVEVQNNTGEPIEAIEIDADCFNKFDEPVKDLMGKNRFSAHYKHAIGPREKTFVRAQMSLQRHAAKADVWISRAKIGNGEVWTQTKEKASETPYGLARARLVD